MSGYLDLAMQEAGRAGRAAAWLAIAASLILAAIISVTVYMCQHDRPARVAALEAEAAARAPSNTRAVGHTVYDRARASEAWSQVYEFTDPANGERFLIVVGAQGVAITRASPPLPVAR